MKQDVHKFIMNNKLFLGGETVIVAVSGGPDSMALLHYLWSMREMYQIKVYAAHAHHQLRGSEADEDEAYIEAFCAVHHIHLFKTRLQVKQYAKLERIGTQSAARELRYKWFDSLLADESRRYIATGHHGDDQVETILMKLIRGSIPFHLQGMAAKRRIGKSMIVRPFLGITREQIEQYCNNVEINPRRDSSNDSDAYTRNRFRHYLLPFVKRENQNVHIHVQRQSEWLSDDHHFLMDLAKKELTSILVEKSEQMITISQVAFLRRSVSLQRRMIHLILNYISGKNSPIITSIHIEQIMALLRSGAPSKELQIANDLFIYRDYEICHFSLNPKGPPVEEETISLPIPGTVQTKIGMIKAFYAKEDEYEEEENEIAVDADEINLPLMIRFRLEGDRIEGQGMKGSKKLSRLFIDRKVSKHLREQWPIIVDAKGLILWVPLLHRTRWAEVTNQTREKLILSLTPDAEVQDKE